VTTGLRLYRGAARAAAAALIRHPLVDAVYVRRGVAAGEVAFARSDIDLSAIVRRPEPPGYDARGLLSLSRLYASLRVAVPALGECSVHDPVDLRRWHAFDRYRASIDARAARLLAGEAVEIAGGPVRREDALFRFAFWQQQYLPTAIRRRDARNVRKLALEMANAYAVAVGALDEPLLTRAETEALVRDRPDVFAPATFDGERPLRFAFQLAGQLRPALEPVREPLVFRALLPPAYAVRTFVVLARPETPLPEQAFARDSFVCTPESLALYVERVNPFASWTLSGELGLDTPGRDSFLRAARYFTAQHRLRGPGFLDRDTLSSRRHLCVVQHALPVLERGEPPQPLSDVEVAALPSEALSPETYYRRAFAQCWHEGEELWQRLDALLESK
jgi:predicted nucleotidyltransferase